MSLILTLLGLGGGGVLGIVGHFLGWNKPIYARARRVPSKVWWVLGGAVALGVLIFLHQMIANGKIEDAYNRGRADEAAIHTGQALVVNDVTTSTTDPITNKHRSRNDEETGRIRATADSQRLRGAGAAVCRDPALAQAPGGHEGSAGSQDAALPRVPYPGWSELLALPSDDAAGFAEQHDTYRSRLDTWNKWYDETYTAWERLRADAAAGKLSKRRGEVTQDTQAPAR